jgi:uncharacterized membrane protein YdbT with pleckstrin-like domain
MSYIEKNLMTGESIMYRAKLHWIVFLWPIIWFVLAGLSLTKYGNTEGGKILAGIFILLAIIMGIGSQIKYSTSEFGITNKRVIVKVGFIRRNSIEVLLSKVEGIQVNQGILGRILGTSVSRSSKKLGFRYHLSNRPTSFLPIMSDP